MYFLKITIIILILLFIILSISNIYSKKKLSINQPIKFYKPKNKNNKLLQELLDNNNIKYNKNWNLYIPGTYTNVEQELNNLIITDKNQIIFGIRGCDKFVSKNGLWFYFDKCLGRNTSNQFLPETYLLKKDIALFKNNYEKNCLYLLKKNIQQKKGIKITKNLNEILNASKDYVVVQKYIPNLYLLKNRKINLRMYLLIICEKDNQSWYLNKLGKCIYTNKDYNPLSNNLEVHLTSLNLNKNIYNKLPLSLEDLKHYIGKPTYKLLFKKIVNLIKTVKLVFTPTICKKCKNNTYFQVFGLDIVFTKDYYPYLLEINKGPQMRYVNDLDKKIKYKVLSDAFSLVNLIKSAGKNSYIKI
uniref:Tubulin-tyrosine ligase n=1 Tax=viral metagenome TaxID=1070528 RepID=A0A6C0IW26_9ZZZZ